MARQAHSLLRRLGESLRRYREAHGWSQEELAYRCGLHRTYIGAVERGEYNVTVLTLQKIATALRTTLSEVINQSQ